MHSYLLVLRFAAFNIAALALLVVVWLEGWIGLVVESDVTHITSGIALVFAIGWFISAYRVLRCSRELNAAIDPDTTESSRALWYRDLADKARPDGRGAIADCLRSRLYARIAVVRTIGNTLPQIRFSVITGGLLAFLTSLDEVIVALFVSGGENATITRRMFNALRDQIDPTIASISTLLIAISMLLLITAQVFGKERD